MVDKVQRRAQQVSQLLRSSALASSIQQHSWLSLSVVLVSLPRAENMGLATVAIKSSSNF
jgi:hypothetical protein